MFDLSSVKRESDRIILEQLIERGDNLVRPRDTVVFFYLLKDDVRHGATVRAELAHRLEQGAWTTCPTMNDDGVIGHRDQLVDPASVNKLIDDMEAIAVEFGVEFDGWECAVLEHSALGKLLRRRTGRA